MPLSSFHPIIAEWFSRRLGTPTDVQAQSWPAIRSGSDVLISAPTGSGKTLAAFLSCIDALLKQALACELSDKTQVVYISPLKALSNDVQKNLQQPLLEISEAALAKDVKVIMKRYLPCHRQNAFAQRTCQNIAMLLGVPLVVMLTIGPVASARGPQVLSEEAVAERAKGAWKNGAINSALDILDQGIQDNPHALTLYKLRGDVLATSRRPREAVEAYESVLASKPTALDVRWAKWSVLIRSGQGEASIAELQRIAHVDVRNPLIHLRLALELRNLDRLEESLVSYKKAVRLVPDFLSWRLGLARAYFDVLDYQGAQDEVDYVLQRVPPGSTLELLARNLLSLIYGSSKDRGRRFAPVYTPDATAGQLKEWAIIRGDAWRLYAAGRYAEAEPVYRSALALNPGDPTATHQLALILMELGRCEEAIPFFKLMSNVDSTEEQYADTVFRIGQAP